MTVRDALNRAYNLGGTAIVAIAGFAFFPEFFTEGELTQKLDEGVLFLLAIGSIACTRAVYGLVSFMLAPHQLHSADLRFSWEESITKYSCSLNASKRLMRGNGMIREKRRRSKKE